MVVMCAKFGDASIRLDLFAVFKLLLQVILSHDEIAQTR